MHFLLGRAESMTEDEENEFKKTKLQIYLLLLVQVLFVVSTVVLFVLYKCYGLPGAIIYFVYVYLAVDVILCGFFAYSGVSQEQLGVHRVLTIYAMIAIIVHIILWAWVIVGIYNNPKKPPKSDEVIAIKKKKDKGDPDIKLLVLALGQILISTMVNLALAYKIYQHENFIKKGQPATAA